LCIQTTTLKFNSPETHQKELNSKLCKSIEAFNEQNIPNGIFLFASLFDFKITNPTNKKIKEAKYPVIVLEGKDFDHLVWPFHLLREKDALANPKSLAKLLQYFKEKAGIVFFIEQHNMYSITYMIMLYQVFQSHL